MLNIEFNFTYGHLGDNILAMRLGKKELDLEEIAAKCQPEAMEKACDMLILYGEFFPATKILGNADDLNQSYIEWHTTKREILRSWWISG